MLFLLKPKNGSRGEFFSRRGAEKGWGGSEGVGSEGVGSEGVGRIMKPLEKISKTPKLLISKQRKQKTSHTSRTLREIKTILATVFRFTLVPQKSCGWAAKASVEVREVGEKNFSPHLTIPRSQFPIPQFRPYFIGLKCVFGVKKGAGKIFTKLGWRG